jgi:hypothetical protein
VTARAPTHHSSGPARKAAQAAQFVSVERHRFLVFLASGPNLRAPPELAAAAVSESGRFALRARVNLPLVAPCSCASVSGH